MIWTERESALARLMFGYGYTDAEIGTAVGRKAAAVTSWRLSHGLVITPEIREAKKNHKEEREKSSYSDQLCWHCAKATGGGDCEWVDSKCREPVPGWNAEEVEPRAVCTIPGPWYRIHDCPKFAKG